MKWCESRTPYNSMGGDQMSLQTSAGSLLALTLILDKTFKCVL